MADDDEKRVRRVPSSRTARLGAFGRLAGGVAGGVLAEGARRLARGERPRMQDMLLTPGNAMRLADRLSHLRGAAMKLGQMISMDAGDMLPPELADILARLRENADRMPPAQLRDVLDKEWGKGWLGRFANFNPRPIAAASIGQVHRATMKDGREIAIKVQYPGVKESIDADVDNVATLLRVSGLLPKELAIDGLLEEAKRQLHEEADYEREAAQMMAYRQMLAGEDDFIVPEMVPEFSTGRVLAMDFIAGTPIEALVDAPQDERNAVTRRIIALVLRELFEFGVMQTDPNFANYRYQADSGKLVLLDFGATRAVDPAIAENYRKLLAAGLAKDRAAVREAALEAGFVGQGVVDGHADKFDRMIDIILAEMHREGPFDFGDRAFVEGLRDEGMAMAQDKATWHIPPVDMLFVQRKISGTALLGARLKAKVDVREMAREWVE
ncbi:ABC1 kinase family protein [Aurantiacibacter gangjinensis]|uniref:Ubiquinol-cytochrome C reductase n=1 Tax=Aurantiacibacter gangjinensis TaxID=502682 RepID=A0A0G9MRY4_9SPHN|nr:AarF/ABC1/UbiB kinase family protein [Aurantiacibacter gangjinensis]APE27087.1 Ubiquinone biosynthesis monooxygenase UbiB [Aurantiacibacter gangjinensis]KLE33506.1 ubiquinol-cytochrome C reductase [Aurantiacibacter gangjinensis]